MAPTRSTEFDALSRLPKPASVTQAHGAANNPSAADPLINRGDLSFLKTRQTMETYASALPGTAPREFFERVNEGQPAGMAAARIREQFGQVIPGEDLEAAKEYQAKRLLTAPMIELDLGQAPSPVMKPGVSAAIPGSHETEGRATQITYNQVQRAAQQEYASKLNAGIGTAAAELGSMEAHGLTKTPEYEAVSARYQNLLHAANPTTTSLDLSRAREAGILRLAAMDDQTRTRVSPALLEHYELVASGGNHMPRPAIGGRYAGQESPTDLPLNRDHAIMVALRADATAPNVQLLLSRAGASPEQMGLDQHALQAMWVDSRQAAADHQTEMDATITAPPDVRRRLMDHIPSGPKEPNDGGSGLTGGPGGPERPTIADPNPGGRHSWQPPSTPEAHSSEVLQQQISDIEVRAKKEMDRQKLLLALDLLGNLTVAAAESAVAIGSAPINGDAGQTLTHVATGFRDSIGRYGEYREQAIRVTNKADVDIKGMLAQHAKEQRDVAELWAEKMQNQMAHLKAIPVDVADLDKAEQKISGAVLLDEGFVAKYKNIKDADAVAIHLAASDELRMSPDPELRKLGLKAAEIVQDSPPQSSWHAIEAVLQKRMGAEELETFGGFRAELEDRHHEWAVQEEAQMRIVASLEAGKGSRHLEVLVGDHALAERIAEQAEKAATNGHSASQVVAESLAEKAKVERSVSAAWRELTAHAPVHAQSVVTGGLAAEAQLANLYGRRRGVDPSPDRQAVYAVQEHFLQLSRGGGEGIPEGWGIETNLGRKVGIALSPNGSVQSLLLGHDHTGKLQGASIHLMARERASLYDTAFLQAGLSADQVLVLRKAQALDPQLAIYADLGPRELRGPSSDPLQLTRELASKYNAALESGLLSDAKVQLQADAWRYAGIRSGVTDPILINAYRNNAATNPRATEIAEGFVVRYRNHYEQHAEALIARERLSRGLARPMATQILQSRTLAGFQQTVESNSGGHFTYPGARPSLDPSPAHGLKSDFRHLMNAADHKFTGMAGELATARAKGLNLVRDPNLLAKAGSRSQSISAILDTPIRQSELGGRPAGGNEYKVFVDAMRARGGRL